MTDKKVIIITTGGTIAGIGNDTQTTGYTSGCLSASGLIDSIPAIKDIAPIEVIELCNINSDDITYDIWAKLVCLINARSKENDIAGFVITHGTDTLEETAFFLNLTVNTTKPVILTGAMRPSNAISPDGPFNLYQAICTAISPNAIGKGVLVVFGSNIYSARFVTKTNTYSLNAITGLDRGPIGTVIDDKVHFDYSFEGLHTIASEFNNLGLGDISRELSEIKIGYIYFSVGINMDSVKASVENLEGVVLIGAGMGEYSKELLEIVDELSQNNVPVVITSRNGSGIIPSNALLSDKTIASRHLSPQKAAILLRLCLIKGYNTEKIRKIFEIY